MRLHNYIVLGAALWMSLVSCETREAITGDDTNLAAGTGALALSVNAKDPVSTKSGVSTSDFPVIISTAEGEIVKEYDKVKNLPEAITLEVGDYVVDAHSSYVLEKEMDKAYYAGSAELEIKNQITSTAVVTCTRQNTRIRMEYTSDFLNAFKSWYITVNDGSDSVLEYTNDNKSPDDVYWYFESNTVEKIKVEIVAVTAEGQSITDNRTFTKADAVEKYEDEDYTTDERYFAGGDALHIKLGAASLDAPTEGTVTGVDISVDIQFDGSTNPVEIPVEDVIPVEPTDPDTPNTPSTGEPTLTLEGAYSDGTTVSFDESGIALVKYSIESENWPTSNVEIKTPGKLKSLKATIVAGNEGFGTAVKELEFINKELVDDDSLESLLAGFEMSVPMPDDGVESYTFPIGQFYSLMNIYGPSVDADQTDWEPDGKDQHVFHITVEDYNGQIATAELRVQISK